MRGPERAVLGLLAVALAMALVAGLGGGARGLSPGPNDPYTIDITMSQDVAKTNDTVGMTFQSFWTNTTYWNYTYYTYVQEANNTTLRVPHNKSVVNTTYIPSPGPVLIQVKDSEGRDIVGASGIHNLTLGIYTVSFLITPAFGLDTITFYAKDLFTNASAQPARLQVDYSEAQRQADTQAGIGWVNNLLTADHNHQEAERWFWFFLQSGAQWFLVIVVILAVTYRVQKRAGVNTWWDNLHKHHGFTSVVNPMRYAGHSVRTKTLNVPAEIAAKETLWKKKQAVEVLTELRNELDELGEYDRDLVHLESIEKQARSSLGLTATPREVKRIVSVEPSKSHSK